MQNGPEILERLDDDLALRSARDERDVERVAAFNGLIHGAGVAALTRHLFLHHPNTQLDDLIYVQDERTDEVVSSLCLIPWTWRYEGVDVPAGELGIVGTREDYRRRGLIRAQMVWFKRRLRERGCLLSHIQGIPYYYRQFGYEYALPLEGGLRLETRHVPPPPEAPFGFRQATLDDLPGLEQLYDSAARALAIHTVRDAATWRYLLTHRVGTETAQETWILQDAGGEPVGYFCVPEHHFGEELVVSEVSRLSFDAALAVLNQLKALSVERAKPGIRLNLPADCTLMQVARSLRAYDQGTYAWQIHVPDRAALLRALAPALERRVAASPFAGLTQDLPIDLYRETLLLRFERGTLAQVERLDAAPDASVLRCPPLPFIPLLLGYRTLDQLRAAYPDVGVTAPWRLLVETLFPPMSSFIHTIY